MHCDLEVWLNRVMLQIAPNPCRSDLHSYHQVFPTENSNVRSSDNMQSMFEIAQRSTYKNRQWGISAGPFNVKGKNYSAGIIWKIFDLSSSSCGNFASCISVSKINNFALKSCFLWTVKWGCYLHPDGRTFLYGALDLSEELVHCWCWDLTNPVAKSSSWFAYKSPNLQVICACISQWKQWKWGTWVGFTASHVGTAVGKALQR